MSRLIDAMSLGQACLRTAGADRHGSAWHGLAGFGVSGPGRTSHRTTRQVWKWLGTASWAGPGASPRRATRPGKARQARHVKARRVADGEAS